MPELDDAQRATLTRRFQATLAGVVDNTTPVVTRIWDGLDNYDEESVRLFTAAATGPLEAAQTATLHTATGYYSVLTGIAPPAITTAELDVAANLREPFISTWQALAAGHPYDEAVDAGRNRIEAVVGDLTTSTARQTGDVFCQRAGLKVTGWKRVTHAGACGWCELVSGQTYKTADTADFGHTNCRCTVAPLDFEPTAPTPARHTKAKVSDPSVLADASRLNLSPERVIELREEKAARRYLEERARREAAKTLTVDSEEVVAVAKRFGIDPDEVLVARHRVADVRAAAREEAARTQLAAMRELDRLDTIKLKAPPRKGARTGGGRQARGGEYDFLEQLSTKERARLSREWYGGSLAPDQFAANMAEALGRDISVDEAMDLWLDLNRRAEAAGALRRGKIPNLDGYSGQIDAADLIPNVVDEGYDPSILFGDDLTAAGHVAKVEANLVRDDAYNYLGEAANPVEGPSPYRMSFQSWEDEVRTLEADRQTNTQRYAELVPRYLDDPELDFEELYARIITTARKAGEEVPDYATIPWN